MRQSLWALAALSFILSGGCTDGGPSGDGSDGHTDGVDTGDTDTPQPGTGGINVHGVLDGNAENCQVVIDDAIVGNTDEDIVGFEPGLLNFALGDPSKVTLDGRPYHVTDDEQYATGNGSVTIVADTVVPAEVNLAIEQQHQCVATDCDWPYEGQACSGRVYEDPEQWIYVDSIGVVRGTENSTVVSGVQMTLIDGEFSVTATDGSLEISDVSFDPAQLVIKFTTVNEAFEGAQQVTCSPK